MRDGLSDFYTFPGTDTGFHQTEEATACLSLSRCVNQVITQLGAETGEPADEIISDIPPGMYVSTHKETLVTLLTRLGRAIIINKPENCIHISAKSIGNIGLVHLRSTHVRCSNELLASMRQAEQEAERLGGCVTFSNNGMYGVSLAFTFINH